MPLQSKNFILLFIVVSISVSLVRSQRKESNTTEYRFQITELSIPKLAPDGYESILSVELDTPLYPDRAYEVGFWIIGRQLDDRGYSYPINIFPSKHMERVSEDIFDLVESNAVLPTLEVRPPPSFTGRGHFTFIIRPDTLYQFITIALQKNGLGRVPIDFRKDVTVTGVFVKPIETNETDDSTVSALTERPKKLAERELIDSNKSYTVRQRDVLISLYDHRNIDKDVVTIYLNDKIVVEKLPLKRKKQGFKVRLRPGTNSITLYAENLGEVAPNTAAILIESDSKEYKAVLESDLGQSQYFTLIYKPR
ncbi:hypothetical protein FK220_002495 [Flavobacteriaceae bacterium TP-CH-4]|uniref:Uncharacterized protein n=1 Tax=Pelagihabitans pacificus TaxID=2696054 RepID=A0A967AQ75_9FLAO|nr:hypothetical protein [Pelagihabitans pacificus]NHF58194.1 hypothetical protein [Pelagihabitans pacificus]